MNPDLMLTPFIRINSQWIMDLHVEHMTIKILGKKKRKPLIPEARLDTKSTTHKRKTEKWTWFEFKTSGISLVVQWLRICLPMWGTGVRPLVWEDPTRWRATKPTHWTTEAPTARTRAPQREATAGGSPCPTTRESKSREAKVHVWLLRTGREHPWWLSGQESPCQCTGQNTCLQIRSLGWEDALEKDMATHSSIPAWEIPWAEEPGGLQSMGLQRAGQDWAAKQQLQRAGGMGANEYLNWWVFGFFLCDEDVLKLITVMVTQFCEYVKKKKKQWMVVISVNSMACELYLKEFF